MDDDIITLDIDAVRDAIEALQNADIDVQMVRDVERDDGRITWTMDCSAETRTADLSTFDQSDDD